MNENASVFRLINSLCSSLIEESDVNGEALTLKRAKQIAFQVLLKKNFDNVIKEKLIEELQFTSFELSLADRTYDSEQIDNFIEACKDKPTELYSICWLLLDLKNIDPDPVKAKHRVTT